MALPLSQIAAKARAAWLTARRAGTRRSLLRVQRIIRLRAMDPLLGRRRYPARAVTVGRALGAPARACLAEIARYRGLASDRWAPAAGTVDLLNQGPVELDWLAPPPVAEPLWPFRLHSWDWAWAALNDERHREHVLRLWRDWMASMPVGAAVAWEPYPVSRRLVVWAAAWHLLGGDAALLSGIMQHARYLAHHLERDLDNNHLVANAKALAWVGLLFEDVEGAGRWREQGLRLLWETLERQVRRDGGHDENTASYHLAVLLDGLETACLCRALGQPVPDSVKKTLGRMVGFALALRRPDGTLPLLSDSIADEPLPAAELFAYLQQAGEALDLEVPALLSGCDAAARAAVFRESGLVVFQSTQDDYLVLDAGELGPRHCPGHGHADALSFELWGRGEPLIVDPGTYQYAAGRWRDYFRSTRAHSTITVDGVAQSTFHGPFRVGDMAHARLLQVQREHLPFEVLAEHDGYARLSDPVIHRRQLRWEGHGRVTIDDTLTGHDVHRFELVFHLAPCEVQMLGPATARATFPGGTALELRVQGPPSGRLSITEGWMSETWYRKVATPVIVYSGEARFPQNLRTDLYII